MGAGDHAIALFQIEYGCVPGFLYFATLILWLIVRINGQNIVYMVVMLRIFVILLLVNSVLPCGLVSCSVS